jgi:hypothetical protein
MFLLLAIAMDLIAPGIRRIVWTCELKHEMIEIRLLPGRKLTSDQLFNFSTNTVTRLRLTGRSCYLHLRRLNQKELIMSYRQARTRRIPILVSEDFRQIAKIERRSIARQGEVALNKYVEQWRRALPSDQNSTQQ